MKNNVLLEKILKSSKNPDNYQNLLVRSEKDIELEISLDIEYDMIFENLYNQIGFDNIFSKSARQKEKNLLLFKTLIDIITNPQNKKVNYFFYYDDDYDDDKEDANELKVEDVIDLMYLIDGKTIETIKKVVNNYSKKFLFENFYVVFYEYKSIFSNINKKLNYTNFKNQVIIAFIYNSMGIPIDYEIIENENFEIHQIDNILKLNNEKYSIKNARIIAEESLIKNKNFDYFTKAKQEFIIGINLKNLDKNNLKAMTNLNNYKLFKGSYEDDAVKYFETTLPDSDLRLIITHNKNQVKKDQVERAIIIKKIRERLMRGKSLNDLITDDKYRNYIKILEEGGFELDNNFISESTKLDGFHGVVTNMNKDYNPDSILESYNTLKNTKKAFDLKREEKRKKAIFQITEEILKASISLNYLFLVFKCILENKIGLEHKRMSLEKIVEELKNKHLTILKDTKTKRKFSIPSSLSDDARKITQILDIKWMGEAFEVK